MPLPDKFNLSGTPEQIAIVLPILEAMYLGFKDIKAEGGVTSDRLFAAPEFEDWLQLTLHWRGVTELTMKNHTVQKSLRLKGINPQTITLAYLQELGRKVLAKFDNMNFKTGHVKVKYTNWRDGFQTWGYFENATTGYRIIESMGDIVGKSIDGKLVRAEYSAYPDEAFDPTPSKITVVNKSIRPKAKAPIATMKFYGASILFPWIKHEEQLCNISGYIIKDLSFLNAYED